jgi:drug/metabolite transporter (DMT)-like permease
LNKKALAYLSLTTTSLIWSVGAILIKYSLNYTTPYTFLFYRFGIVSIIFLPLLIRNIRKEKLELKELPSLFLIGTLSTTITLLLLFWGTKLTSATEAVIINALSPIFIITGAAIFLKEKISFWEKVGISLAFLGSLAAIVQPIVQTGIPGSSLTGNILVFISAIAWAGYTLITRKNEKAKKFSPLTITAISFIGGFLTITPFYLLQDVHNRIPLDLFISHPAFPGIMYMTFLGSCIAYFTYNLGYSLIKASQASIFTYLQPVFSVPMAIVLLGDKIDAWIIVGAILILAGIFLTEFKLKSHFASAG